MAYARLMPTWCCATCGAIATHEVYDNDGNRIGFYDQEHALELASRLNGAETGEVLTRA